MQSGLGRCGTLLVAGRIQVLILLHGRHPLLDQLAVRCLLNEILVLLVGH